MEWSTLVEEFAETGTRGAPSYAMGEPQTITSISLDPQLRLKTGIAEFDRTLGGGLVPGSLILIGVIRNRKSTSFSRSLRSCPEKESRPCTFGRRIPATDQTQGRAFVRSVKGPLHIERHVH
jgi:hypothetical protein